MIHNWTDLRYYITEDRKRYNVDWPKPTFKDYLLHNEKWYTYQYLSLLRYVEYFKNTNKTVLFLFATLFLKRLGLKLRYNITPNIVGPCFIIFHTGDRCATVKRFKIGRNFTMRPGCIFANKGIKANTGIIEVGDNVTFGWGGIVIGKVKIGDNVSVGAHAVITKDIPDNCIVGGIPAKIINIYNLHGIYYIDNYIITHFFSRTVISHDRWLIKFCLYRRYKNSFVFFFCFFDEF